MIFLVRGGKATGEGQGVVGRWWSCGCAYSLWNLRNPRVFLECFCIVSYLWVFGKTMAQEVSQKLRYVIRERRVHIAGDTKKGRHGTEVAVGRFPSQHLDDHAPESPYVRRAGRWRCHLNHLRCHPIRCSTYCVPVTFVFVRKFKVCNFTFSIFCQQYIRTL